jgi:DNA-binding transcriptional ArsR family regulator
VRSVQRWFKRPELNTRLASRRFVEWSRQMEIDRVILALAALAQPTRLDVFRMLVSQEPHGLAAGEIARRSAVPHNTMSSHLGVLSRAGLIRPERRSRSIVYRVDLERFRAIATFLLTDCCGGRPDICATLLSELAPQPATEAVDA